MGSRLISEIDAEPEEAVETHVPEVGVAVLDRNTGPGDGQLSFERGEQSFPEIESFSAAIWVAGPER
jgi:hypothetical protein